MSVISLVIDKCFAFLGQCFDFLTRIEVAPGISLFNIVLGIIVFSTVLFGLIATVRTLSGGSVSYYKRSARLARRRSRSDN